MKLFLAPAEEGWFSGVEILPGWHPTLDGWAKMQRLGDKHRWVDLGGGEPIQLDFLDSTSTQ